MNLSTLTSQAMDPDVHAVLVKRANSSRPIWEKTPAEARRTRSSRQTEALPAGFLDDDSSVTRDREIRLGERRIPIRIYSARRRSTVAILFFHGGGFVTGGLDTHHDQALMLAEVTGRTVVSVDYRLAPEHPFPAADEDARAVLDWLRSDIGAEAVGISVPQVAVAGVSAGANLAANLGREYARRGEPVVAQLLAYPWLSANLDTPSRAEFQDTLGLSTRALRWYTEQYLPDPADREGPAFSPLAETSFAGLPPTVLSVAMLDPLRDDGLLYGELVREAGVEIWEQRCESLPHGFWGMTGHSSVARAHAYEFCAEFTRVLDTAEAEGAGRNGDAGGAGTVGDAGQPGAVGNA